MRRRVKVFFDGGCRPNPGRIEAAVVVRGVAHVSDDLGIGSNSDAEWLALIRALEVAHAQGLGEVDLIGDAVEVIGHADRALRGGEPANHHAVRFVELAAKGPPVRVRWIRRAQNLAGIALAARHPR